MEMSFDLSNGQVSCGRYLIFLQSLLNDNIVGMIRSKRTGTADDNIVIVGAHYDTAKNTNGVNDNGSGVAALLEVAKIIGKQPLNYKSLE